MFSRLRQSLKHATSAPVTDGGTLGIVYGRAEEASLARAAQNMRAVVVEPGFFPSPPLPHAYAYVPLSGFHSDNLAHRPLLAGVEQADGFLYDPSGIRLSDPHGAGTKLINYRKKQVAALMRQYIEECVNAGYRGFFFDAIDSFILAEKLAPNIAGAANAAASFLEETIPMLTRMGGDVVVNGGLYSIKGVDLMPALGRSGAALATEHQYTDGKGGLRPAKDNDWTKSRLAVFATAAASAGHGVRVYFIEGPVAREKRADAYRDGARWAEQLLLPIKRRLNAVKFEYGIYFCESADYATLTPLP